MGLLGKLDSGLFAVDMAARMVVERLETGIVFNPTRKAMRADPHPFYRRLRERDPFHRSRPADGWVLTRYADLMAVLAPQA